MTSTAVTPWPCWPSPRPRRLDGGGHTWPGSEFGDNIVDIVGYNTHSISANEIMWAFFQAHPLTG